MNRNNYTIIYGIIDSVDDKVLSSAVDAPILKILSFNKKEDKWNDLISVVLTENDEARKTQGYVPGDIVLIFGTVSFVSNFGIIVYAQDFIMLSKNTQNQQLKYRIPLVFEYNIDNIAFIAGDAIKPEEAPNVCISVQRTDNIHGTINRSDLIPVECPEYTPPKEYESAIFSGIVNGTKLYGDIIPAKY